MAFRPSTRMDVKAGDAGDSYSGGMPSDFPSRFISAESWTNAMMIKLANDGSTFTDEFEIDPDRPIVFPFAARAVDVKNKQSGLTARYQVGLMD